MKIDREILEHEDPQVPLVTMELTVLMVLMELLVWTVAMVLMEKKDLPVMLDLPVNL